MINFGTISTNKFLNDYWQKKPLVIRQAIPYFVAPITADELAGLALEDEIESRMVFETPGVAPYWQLKTGPFVEADFRDLPKTHWTLLVQGVDRLIPDVMLLLQHFDFLPQWRVDDVMISYAVKHGSVGPHYDDYDVFLYQASGRRKWSLTTKNCHKNNCMDDVELRLMAEFTVEEEYVLEPGDMLYLPAHVGHYGVSLDDTCMTYSFGYRSNKGQELWDNFGDFLSEHEAFTTLYKDPNWASLAATSALPRDAWLQAKSLLEQALADEMLLKTWFASFITRPDQQAEQHMPLPLEQENCPSRSEFIKLLQQSNHFLRDATCRMVYLEDGARLFINGVEWNITGVSPALVKVVANSRVVTREALLPFILLAENQTFLYELWQLQWLQ